MVCKAPIFDGPEQSDMDWSNWAGSFSYRVEQFFEPSHSDPNGPPDGLLQLVNIVNNATEQSKRLHAVGSGWAYENVAATDAWLVSLNRLTRRLAFVIPRALTDQWRRLQEDARSARRLVHYEAGIEIGALCESLDADGLAMPTLGGANGQSLAGAISTSTHGGDLRWPPLPDIVMAIHLVGVGGREFWIERASAPITDDDRLKACLSCPDAAIIRSDLIFNAAVVSVGRFGIIYAFVLEVRNAFRLVEVVVKPKTADVIAALREGQAAGDQFGPLMVLLRGMRFPSDLTEVEALRLTEPHLLQLVFDTQNTSSCFVTLRWETDTVRDIPAVPDSGNIPLTGREVLLIGAAAFVVTAGVAAAIPGAGVVYSAELLAASYEMSRLAEQNQLTFGPALAMVLNTAWALPFIADFIPTVTSAVYGSRFGNAISNGRRGPSYLITSGTLAGSHQNDYRGDFIEMVFDGSAVGHIDFLEGILRVGPSMHQAGWISLRPCVASTALLSMHNFESGRAVSIETTSLKGLVANSRWLGFIHALGLDHGGRPHWGQMNKLDSNQTQQLYGIKLDSWRRALSYVNGNSNLFSNQFTRQRGLEPRPSALIERLLCCNDQDGCATILNALSSSLLVLNDEALSSSLVHALALQRHD